MRIAFDVHGGDYAPNAVIEGVLQAAKDYPEITFVLIGTEKALVSSVLSNIEMIKVTETITAEDEPVKAIRRKKDSSLVVGCRLVKEKAVDAFVCAGNTGALVTAGLFVTGRMKGMDRPALAPIFPSMKGGGTLVLDVGANPEAKPEHLRQYAVMGSIYAKQVMGLERPRIGLLNIGTEDGKGTSLTKDTFDLLANESAIHFIGNVEARDVLDGTCDVLVTDGFSGNILLKNTEGVAKAIFSKLKEEFTRSIRTKVAAGILAPGLKRFKESMDYKEHGGAPLLGLAGPIIKAHGSSDARAFYQAAMQAKKIVEQNVIEQIQQGLVKTEGDEERCDQQES
ncbi:glycerol-3-phosphate acyltransferase PlsX [Croceifilum oryzae]|uniref:Phosphate acyltransferase n=1 Tax=Croceifilum oryzae TaxID=1553429 RepID=A0AAJ1TEC7_9BACL|nr:phosphate acyltransferase PlsX [Croceifilum oryzae]MDQ0417365.1 glycerol-3-phosphate acyltransferase PlsX [Croceifilum oryzae]